MNLYLLLGVPLLALLLATVIAIVVRNIHYPPPQNWVEVDLGVERKPLLQHAKDCGLIYPVLYVYILFGVYNLIEWNIGASLTLFK